MCDGPVAIPSPIERIRFHLANLPGDIGCRHLARDRDGFDARLIVLLGLAKPIVQKVPACVSHGCPLRGTCAFEPDFDPEASRNKSGVKYRPTPDGMVAAGNPSLIGERIVALPLAARVMTLLRTGPLSPFSLHAGLHGIGFGVGLDASGAPLEPISRPALGLIIETLAALGHVAIDDIAGTFALNDGEGP